MFKTHLPARKHFLKAVYNANLNTQRQDWSFQGESADGKGKSLIGFLGWDELFEERDGLCLYKLEQQNDDSYGAKLWNEHARELVQKFETTDGVILSQARNEDKTGLKYYHTIHKILFTVPWKGSTYAVCGKPVPTEQLWENRQFSEEVANA